MFQHILLPVDFTDKNEAAIEIARQLASAAGSRVTLLHVIEPIEGVTDEETVEFYDLLESRARSALTRLRARLAAQQIDAEFSIVFGKRSAEIVHLAEQSAIDLIIMSSRRVDPQAPPQHWPTISHQVAVFSSCPVLLAR